MSRTVFCLNKEDLVIPTDEELNLLEVTFRERTVDLGIVM